jgi:hypothetical protein
MDQRNSVEIHEKGGVTLDILNLSDAARRRERKLRTKIDFCVVPTVTLLYLMCFVDRSNIGKCNPGARFLRPTLTSFQGTPVSLASRRT